MTTMNSKFETDNADLISYHAMRTGQMPSMFHDGLTSRIVGEVTLESANAFQVDTHIQRYLSAKTAIWRIIKEMRNRGAR